MGAGGTCEAYAVRYGALPQRTRGENFIMADDHAAPMPIHDCVWALAGAERTIVVDTGCDRAEGERRGWTWSPPPDAAGARVP